MAQTGYTPISIYYSSTAAATPTAGNLVAGELAINTADGKLFYKDSAGVVQTIASKDTNSGTFTNISVSGVASFADGTVSLPSITNIGDTNTGIFFPAADTIAFTEGGVESMRITSDGDVGIGTSTPQQSLDIQNGSDYQLRMGLSSVSAFSYDIGRSTVDGFLKFYGNQTTAVGYVFGGVDGERMRIASNGNVGIGTASPASKLAVAGNQINFGANPYIALSNAVGTTPTYIQQENTSTGTLTILTSGTGSNGNIAVQVGTGSTNALNVLSGGYTQFLSTISVGSASPSTTGAGITFPATQSASSDANTLDDYEEGTWTPTLVSTGGAAPAYTTQSGKYFKIGGIVYVYAVVQINGTLPAGNYVRIQGLPFSQTSPVSAAAIKYSGMTGLTTAGQFVAAAVGSAEISMARCDSTGELGVVGLQASYVGTAAVFYVSTFYQTA